jgi:hypothetical protein
MARIVEIGDEGGKSLKVWLSAAATDIPVQTQSWRTIDKGFIRFNNGTAEYVKSNGTLYTYHLQLVSGEQTWGIRLNDFKGFWSVNDSGTGFIHQQWVTGLKPGRISWVVVG